MNELPAEGEAQAWPEGLGDFSEATNTTNSE
jgi:hypothetical protein